MTTLVKHGTKATEVSLSPIYPETEITLARHSNCVTIIQNHQLVAIIWMPIMKIVRGIRMNYPQVKMNVI
jgi:hypothetical protein